MPVAYLQIMEIIENSDNEFENEEIILNFESNIKSVEKSPKTTNKDIKNIKDVPKSDDKVAPVSSKLIVRTMVEMVTTNMVILNKEQFRDIFNNAKRIDYDSNNKEGLIKIKHEGDSFGRCKKDTSRRKTPSKRFQNQITFYVRLLDNINLDMNEAIVKNNVYSFEVPIGTLSNTMKIIPSDSLSKTQKLFLKIVISEPKVKVPFLAFDSVVSLSKNTNVVISLAEIVRCKTVTIHMHSNIDNPSKYIKNIALLSITDVNMFMFNTGKIKVANTKKTGDISRAFNILKDDLLESDILPELKEIIDNHFVIKDQSTVMINTDFDCNYILNRETLFRFLREKYGYTCSYEPCIHPAVIVKYYYNALYSSGKCECCARGANTICRGKGNGDGVRECKTVTILIFQSGRVIITGGRYLIQAQKAYEFITTVLQNNFHNFSSISTAA